MEVPCCHADFLLSGLGPPPEFHMEAATNPFLGFSCLNSYPPWLNLGGWSLLGTFMGGANSKQTSDSSPLNLSTFRFLLHPHTSFGNSGNLLLGSLWIPACSLVCLQTVVWGPHEYSLPTYITAWLFKSKESCWHSQATNHF